MDPRTQHEQVIMRGMGELLTSYGFTVVAREDRSNVFEHPTTKRRVRLSRTNSIHDPIEATIPHDDKVLCAWNRKGLAIILDKAGVVPSLGVR